MPVFSGIGQEFAKDAPTVHLDRLAGGFGQFANLVRIFGEEWHMNTIDPAATACLLASTALVLLMTPGLAIF